MRLWTGGGEARDRVGRRGAAAARRPRAGRTAVVGRGGVGGGGSSGVRQRWLRERGRSVEVVAGAELARGGEDDVTSVD